LNKCFGSACSLIAWIEVAFDMPTFFCRDFGYVIYPDYGNQGFGTESIQAVLNLKEEVICFIDTLF
jgi:RimJ/RimL family protein N-acetyltransferase